MLKGTGDWYSTCSRYAKTDVHLESWLVPEIDPMAHQSHDPIALCIRPVHGRRTMSLRGCRVAFCASGCFLRTRHHSEQAAEATAPWDRAGSPPCTEAPSGPLMVVFVEVKSSRTVLPKSCPSHPARKPACAEPPESGSTQNVPAASSPARTCKTRQSSNLSRWLAILVGCLRRRRQANGILESSDSLT